MQRTISKYLLIEMISNFFIGFIVFTFVLLTGRTFQLTDMIVNKGLSVFAFFKLFGLMLPYFLVFTIPMSLALAIILTFGRASYDYEIIALKSSGISLWRLVRPVLIFSVFAWVLTSYLTIFVVPTSNFNLKKYVFRVLRSQINIGIEEKVFNNVGGRIIYVDRIPVRSNHLYGILVFDDTSTDRAVTIIAREGVISSDETTEYFTIRLKNGSVLLSNKYTDSDQLVVFNNYNFNMNLYEEDEAGKVIKKSWEMTIEELLVSINGLRQSLKGFEKEDRKNPSTQNKNFIDDLKSQIRSREVEISKMFAIPCACIVFMILGIPLSVQTNPKGRSGNLVLVILVIFAYYVFMALGEVLGKNGLLPALFSMWLGNVILGALGLYLFVKANRESPVALIRLYNAVYEVVAKFLSRISR
jgi:lipopolysaccharide export system permease protein